MWVLQAGGAARAVLCDSDHSTAASPNVPSAGLGSERGKGGSLGEFQVNQVLGFEESASLKISFS